MGPSPEPIPTRTPDADGNDEGDHEQDRARQAPADRAVARGMPPRARTGIRSTAAACAAAPSGSISRPLSSRAVVVRHRHASRGSVPPLRWRSAAPSAASAGRAGRARSPRAPATPRRRCACRASGSLTSRLSIHSDSRGSTDGSTRCQLERRVVHVPQQDRHRRPRRRRTAAARRAARRRSRRPRTGRSTVDVAAIACSGAM